MDDPLKTSRYLILFLLGIFVGEYGMNRAWEKDAIIRGFGYYSDIGPNFSASFEWVDIVNDEQLKSDSRNLYYYRGERK